MIINCSYKAPYTEKEETWECRIDYIKNYSSCSEILLISKSYIFLTICKSSRGYIACIPDFRVCCYINDFDDIFWNTAKLSAALDSIYEGITIAKAIKHLSKDIELH